MKVSQKSKIIKKVTKPTVKKKAADDKTKEVVALQNKIALMNKKIKLAEKNNSSSKNKSVVKMKTDKKAVDKPKVSNSKVCIVDKPVPRDNLARKKAQTKLVKSNANDTLLVNTKGCRKKPLVKLAAKKMLKKTSSKPIKSTLSKTNPKVVSKSMVVAAPIKTVSKLNPKKIARKAVKESKKSVEPSLKKFEVKPKSSRKRKLEPSENEEERVGAGPKVAYIHVGEGGERDLEDHLRGSSRVNIQILSTERLPDIDDSDMIHGLDHAGTSRDYVDERHRCTVRCPVGCQGHLRPNEIVIYESVRYDGRLLERKRMKGRFVEGDVGEEVVAALEMTDFRRIGGRGNRRRLNERNQRRRMITQQRYRRTMEEDRNDSPIPPMPSRIGVPTGLPQRVGILLDNPPVSREVAEEHSWNTNDRSFNVVLKEDDPLTMRRHPVAQSTDCIRGKIGYSSGIHLWEVTWPVRQRGTHAVVGVATREAVLHSVGYQSLVGNTEHSWGWDLGRKKAYHNSRANEGNNYPPTITHHHQWTVPDTFNMVLDMDSGNLGFVFGDQFLGWSHTSVKTGERVFPIVSTVWGHCEVKLQYLGGLEGGVVGLQELTRGAIRNALSSNGAALARQVETLSLPTQLKKYLRNE